MEIPVMTSASSHRLRSAVGACAKPGHSYLKPSRYSSSGGCLGIIKSADNGGILGFANEKKKKKNKGGSGGECRKSKAAESKRIKCLGIDRIGKVLLGGSLSADDKNNNNNNNGDDERKASHGVDAVRKRHAVTKRTAQISREVYRVWQARVGSSSYATAGQVPLLLKDLRQLDSRFQVRRRLERGGRGVAAGSGISFEDFCSSLSTCNGSRKLCDTGIARTSPTPPPTPQPSPQPQPPPPLVAKDGNLQRARKNRKLQRTMCKYEVFLGGSCNPTTWRTEIAIPDLQRMGITYFNPQVSQWRPDLLEVEYQAKENAAVMFFVIDNQTRGISALIEVAHIAGTKRKLILVIQSYTEEKQVICGEAISREEYEDLRRGQEVLHDLVESRGIPVFDDISAALECTRRVLRENVSVRELETAACAASERCPADESAHVRQAFDAVVASDCSELNVRDACLALRLLARRQIPLRHVENIVRESGQDEVGLEERRINFQEFCSLQSELERRRGDEDLVQGTSECRAPSHAVMRDVYLGGTSKGTSWKEEIAIPMLKENRLSYFNPKASEWSERFSEVEAAAMNASYVLLVVITDSARSVAEMAIAGHYIGLGARMVLCVQELPEEATLGPDKLSENALKDYNRGRMYLADMAKRNGVAVFSDIRDAVSRAVEECKQR